MEIIAPGIQHRSSTPEKTWAIEDTEEATTAILGDRGITSAARGLTKGE